MHYKDNRKIYIQCFSALSWNLFSFEAFRGLLQKHKGLRASKLQDALEKRCINSTQKTLLTAKNGPDWGLKSSFSPMSFPIMQDSTYLLHWRGHMSKALICGTVCHLMSLNVLVLVKASRAETKETASIQATEFYWLCNVSPNMCVFVCMCWLCVYCRDYVYVEMTAPPLWSMKVNAGQGNLNPNL